ncbi:MAG: ligase-associated DNA damage response endonuclease PdeM [Pirellula sp.]|jgi:DNA ligase-associated metallophosphoesterase|nr:ligase-associated DNA damage response endonuclease PdeM [Pirellula sp.]
MATTATQLLSYGSIELELNAEKSAWHAETETLFCSDLHWGKEATFQRASLPVPVQSLTSILNRMSALLDRLRPKRVIVLGDMVHGTSSFSDTFRETMRQFWEGRAVAPECSWILVEGNHDRRAKSELKKWPVRMVSPPWRFEDFVCVHDPLELPSTAASQTDFLCMAGHLHPAFSMPDNGEKLACFALQRNTLIFPAFSDFTGRNPIDIKETQAVYIIRQGEIARYSPPR